MRLKKEGVDSVVNIIARGEVVVVVEGVGRRQSSVNVPKNVRRSA